MTMTPEERPFVVQATPAPSLGSEPAGSGTAPTVESIAPVQRRSTFRWGPVVLWGGGSVLIIGTLVASGLAVAFRAQRDEEARLRKRAEAQLVDAQAEAEAAQREATRLTEANAALTGQLQDTEQRLATLTTTLEAKSQALARLEEARITDQGRVERLTAELVQVQAQMDQVVEERASLAQELEQVRGQLAEVQKPVTLPEIVVSEEPKLEGRVIVAKSASGFVVVDVGRQDHARVGMILSVLRDGQEVRRLRLQEVYEAIASASVEPGGAGGEIREGDVVRER